MTKQARNGMGLAVCNQNQIIIEIVQSNLKSFSPGCWCMYPQVCVAPTSHANTDIRGEHAVVSGG